MTTDRKRVFGQSTTVVARRYGALAIGESPQDITVTTDGITIVATKTDGTSWRLDHDVLAALNLAVEAHKRSAEGQP